MTDVKILHVIYSLGIGGAEMYLASVCEEGKQRALFDSEVLGWRTSGPLRQRLEQSKLHVHEPLQVSKIPTVFQLSSLAKQVAAMAKKNNCTHIHGHLNDGGLLAVLAGRQSGLPSLAHVHSNHVLPMNLSASGHWLWMRAMAWAYRRADRVLTISDEVEQVLKEKFATPAALIRRAPIGVPKPKTLRSREATRQALGLSSHQPVLIFVGRLVPNKNQSALIRMLQNLTSEFPDLCLLLVGDGPDRDSLHALSQELNVSESVRFLGQRDDVGDLLSTSDLFVTASVTEGVSLAILEAFANNTPVLAARAPGNSELLSSNRGWLSSDDQPRNMADAVRRALTSQKDRQTKASNAYCYWGSTHSLSSAASALSSVYENISS